MGRTQANNKGRIEQKDNTANVLIVDDDSETARFILGILARKAIRANLANNKQSAVDFLDRTGCDFVFLNEQISQQPGLTRSSATAFGLLENIRRNSPEMPVVMMGEQPTPNDGEVPTEANARQTVLRYGVRTAVDAIRAGCRDFLIKPLERGRVESLLDTFLPNHEVSTIASAQDGGRSLYKIVGRSPRMIQTVELAKKIAPTSAPVLISGQSGTGKELISYLIHHNSKRVDGPYVRVNCVALSESLLESELFGHEKGAFTGAYAQRRGRFEMAHGGTLLLDEITETPLRFQAKLLRILEQQEFERVGGEKQVRVDVRVISTTNKDLLAEVREGRFRQDLYYRLSAARVGIPPLRQRREDLPDLIRHFVNLHSREAQRRITGLDPAMMEIFSNYDWPGNVRQLRNVVLTSLILGVGETLSLADVSWLFDELQPLPQEESSTESTESETHLSNDALAGIPLEQIERQAILETLRQTAGNRTRAAKALGISDRTLRDKIRRYRRQECLQVT